MPAGLNVGAATRSLTIRTRPSASKAQQTSRKALACQVGAQRWYASETTQQPAGDALSGFEASLSASQATLKEIANLTKMAKNALAAGDPSVVKSKTAQFLEKADIKIQKNTLALQTLQAVANGAPLKKLDSLEFQLRPAGIVRRPGYHKYEVPSVPLAPTENHKQRYEPIVAQVIGMIMKHGKRKAAQRNMGYILNHLRTSPPPNTNPSKPLIPGAPPPSQYPLNPVLFLTIAVDSLAPLTRVMQAKGQAGGGKNLPLPKGLTERQRRRYAIKWILEAVEKRQNRGSGKFTFAHRFAEEVISVVEGRSSAWDKRLLLHKSATAARANFTAMESARATRR